jgi:hypothetical protein
VGLRSVNHGIRPGIDPPRKWPSFNLGELIFDVIGCERESTTTRQGPALDADQTLPEEVVVAPVDAPGGQPSGPQPVRTAAQNETYAKAGAAKMLAATTLAEATELQRKAKADPSGAVDVLPLIEQDHRDALGIGPDRERLALADLGDLVAGYVERRGMSVNAVVAGPPEEQAAMDLLGGQLGATPVDQAVAS